MTVPTATTVLSKSEKATLVEIFGSWESYLKTLPERFWFKTDRKNSRGEQLWGSMPRSEKKIIVEGEKS